MDFIKLGKVNKSIVNKVKKHILSENALQNSKGFDKNFEKNNDNEEEYHNNDKDDDDEVTNKVQKNSTKRPIICICNNLYAKVLTPMRKEALVFHIKRSDPFKLVLRLKELCKNEKLVVDSSTIEDLARKSNYDIRVCINSLQFISYNKQNANMLKTLSHGKLFTLGSKDITEGLFEIWNKIFLSMHKEYNSYRDMLNLYNSYGDFNKINEGLFVNYPKINFSNSKKELENRVRLTEIFSHDDIINKKIHQHQYFELTKFHALPGAFIKKNYFTNDKNIFLDYPTLLVDLKKNKKINSQILTSLKENFNDENVYSRVSKRSLILDILPFLYQLMQPEIREIIPEMMNPKELKSLKSSVNMMYMLGIKFIENAEEEILHEPDISKLLTFQLTEINKNRITLKQKIIIRSEYEKYRSIKEAHKNIDENLILSKNSNISKSKENFISLDQNAKQMKNAYNFLMGTGTFSKIQNEKNSLSNITTNSFGRKRNFSELNNPDYKFVYKFNEGVTNSVKRSLNINYFLK